MKVSEILKLIFVNDSCTIKIFEKGEIVANGKWFCDDVLKHYERETISFTYDSYINTLSIFLI